MLLDPRKPAAEAPVWYFPTGDQKLGEWEGGVLGSVAVNDVYNREGRAAAPGGLHRHRRQRLRRLAGRARRRHGRRPRRRARLRTPRLVFKDWVGGGISTPIIVDDTLIAAGYEGVVHAYRLSYAKSRRREPTAPCRVPTAPGARVKVARERRASTCGGSIESTPIVWDGRVYIGCRDGYFYCLGVK